MSGCLIGGWRIHAIPVQSRAIRSYLLALSLSPSGPRRPPRQRQLVLWAQAGDDLPLVPEEHRDHLACQQRGTAVEVDYNIFDSGGRKQDLSRADGASVP